MLKVQSLVLRRRRTALATAFPDDTPHASTRVIADVRRALRDAADVSKAPGMRAYMKSEMPYYGVATPVQRLIARELFGQFELPSYDAWHDTALRLWREAAHREERYLALALCDWKSYREYRMRREVLRLYEEFVVTGAWWDYIDGIASHRVGELLATHPRWTAHRMRQWSRSPDLWKRRTSILCQLGFKEQTDLELLYDCFEP